MLKFLPTALAVFLSSVACVPVVGIAGPERTDVLAQAPVESRFDGGAIRFTRPETGAPPSRQPTAPLPLEGRMPVGVEPDGSAPAGSAARPSSEHGEPARLKAVAPAAPQLTTPTQAQPTQAQPTQGQPRKRSDTDDASFKVARVASGDVLNVRSGPSPDHDIVGSLDAETRGLRVIGLCRSRWCPIEHRSLTGWVNRAFLTSEGDQPSRLPTTTQPVAPVRSTVRDDPSAPRSCLSAQARALLGQIETKFGPVRAVSTCRPGARIAGTGRVSKHASGNAIDFDAGSRKQAIIDWLVANHHAGGTMTYPDMEHIHVDIGPHFVSLASSGRRVASQSRRFGEPMGLGGRN